MERIIGINPVTEALLNKEKNIEKVCLFKKFNYLWHEIKFIYSQTEMVCEKLAWAGVGANGN